MTGTIVRIFPDRGFCFVQQDGGGPDLFAHIKDFPPTMPFDATLLERRIVYEIVDDSPKGPRAANVRAT